MYTCDDNYVWLMGISMISLFENNKGIDEINIYLMGDGISSSSKEKLSVIVEQYGRTINVIDVPKLIIPDTLYSQRWPMSAYTRLFSGEMLPKKLGKVLYLDCDTLITNDISELWNLDISEFTIYGIKDCIGKAYKENIGLNGKDVYINAGVLLLNLDKLRAVNITRCIDGFLKKYKNVINYSDQDVLNGVFSGQIGTLNPRYNCMTLLYAHEYEEIKILRHPTNYYEKKEIESAKLDPAIVHFTTFLLSIRPWYKDSHHPYAKQFEKYKAESPWDDREFSVMLFNSFENRIMFFLQKIPKMLSLHTIGFLHSYIQPYWIRVKARMF